VEGAEHIELMANLILTTKCQRKCSYCFAQDDKNNGKELTWQNFLKAAKFVATGPKIINILGGEPTLHEKFIPILEYLIINGFQIQVFTNGMLETELLTKLVKSLDTVIPNKDQLFFAININEERYRTKKEIALQTRFMETLRKLTYPSFTIHDKDTNLIFLQDLVEKYNLNPTIRLGMAMPIAGGGNKHLPVESYRDVAENIIEFSQNSKGITITFDCGFPLCMFTLDEIGELSTDEKNDFAFLCGQPLDIHPDLHVSNCYPLAKIHRVSIDELDTVDDAYKYFELGFMTPSGIYGEKCLGCTFFRKACFGGCKGFYIPSDKTN